MLFLEKWREFLEGGMKKRFLSKKGNHPHRAERPSRAEQIKEGRAKRMRAEQTEGRADGRKSRQSREQTECLKK